MKKDTPQRCAQSIRQGWHLHPCGRKATCVEQGVPYCATHAPSRQQARAAARAELRRAKNLAAFERAKLVDAVVIADARIVRCALSGDANGHAPVTVSSLHVRRALETREALAKFDLEHPKRVHP